MLRKKKMAALVPAALYVGARAVFQSKRLAELMERAHVAAKSDAERALYARLRRAYDGGWLGPGWNKSAMCAAMHTSADVSAEFRDALDELGAHVRCAARGMYV
jgi:hypothetical protein